MGKMQRAGKKAALLLLWAMVLAALWGCAGRDSVQPGEQYLLYVGQKGQSLVAVAWEPPEGDTESAVRQALDALRDPEDPDGYTSPVPEQVSVEIRDLADGSLDLAFSPEYAEMEKGREVILRAAVVQSLVQIDGVRRVRFYVGEEPLREADGAETGYMDADDFVRSIGPALNSYRKTELTLYFADGEEEKLRPVQTTVRYSSNTSLQTLIVEQLLKGPAPDGYRRTLPESASLLGVTVRDGVCYVNFDEGFLSQDYEVSADLAVWSLVNSLTESGDVHAVQISVNGETDVTFRGTVDLGQPFERNPDLTAEEE